MFLITYFIKGFILHFYVIIYMTEEDLVFKRENLYRFSFFIENGGVEMEILQVIKRNGDIVDFDRLKIEKAILGAMEDLGEAHINDGLAKRIARDIERELRDGENTSKNLAKTHDDNTSKTLTPIAIHTIEDRVEEKLMGSHCKDVARQYIVYRASKAKIRLEKQALDLLNDSNEELKTENSNKNTILNSTQRDYMAGILCKDISRNYFSKELLRAHDKGMIHIHDLDFSPALPMFNCCLVNLDDMVQNGTRLSDMDIVKPKSFMTACAVTAQIIFAISGNQYGGQTISLSHLAPFVRISKEKYERKYRELGFSGENLDKLTNFSLKKEIKDGIQCLVYNVITMSNSNGQAPFLSIFLWLNEKPNYVKETAMLIEEMIQQRLDGFKDKNGRAVTIAFPKLLYVLDDNNTYPGSSYYYLTELSAKCTAKRMVPDYISAKKMKEYKEGNVFPCMGCVDGDETVSFTIINNSITRYHNVKIQDMWKMMSEIYPVKKQLNGTDEYIDLKGVKILDTKKGDVDCYRIIKNYSKEWVEVHFSNHQIITCTNDHPFDTENRGVVFAGQLKINDEIACASLQESKEHIVRVIDVNKIDKSDYSYDVTTESEHFEVSGIYSHNCRSFLQPYYDENNQPKFYGRFNQGVVTLNLPYVAMKSKGNIEEFWRLMEEATQKCYEALMIRHNRLKRVKSDVSPVHWQYGGLARLKPGETIEKLLYDDYSSISLGYAGLYECTNYMTGYSHTDERGHDFAIQVMKFLNDKCKTWKENTHIGFSLYGTPLESTTGKFAKALQRDFGIVKDVSDHDYVTNSYHICVRENIDAFSKLKFESEFQGLSTGGMISYIEVPSMYTNIEALLSVMQYIYENTMYAEINTKSDYCFDCGFEGEIESVQDENGKYIWRCPNCGNTKLDRMSVVRRTCGYIGSNYWNQARTAEIHDRVLHL